MLHRLLRTSTALCLSALALTSALPRSLGAQAAASPNASAPGLQEFTILIFESAAQLATRTSPGTRDAYWDAYDRFADELAQAGVLRGGSALDERARSTVRGNGSADLAVRRARLGGYFVIAAVDLAAAERWALKAPPLALAVEVRPHRPNPHMQPQK